MKGIAEFFSRIRNIQLKETRIRSVVRDAIQKQTGCEVAVESIVVKRGVVTIRPVDANMRSVLYMKKEAILKELDLGQGSHKEEQRMISDIRW